VHERILIAEDDPSVSESARLLLEGAGFVVTTVADGRRALEVALHDRPDGMLLDVMLPSMDGFEVCREIRRTSQVPIVMLTARTETTDIVVGLELGADDYITKPFDPAELVARVRAAVRRAGAEPTERILRFRELEIDVAAFSARISGSALELTSTEFRLLLELANHAGQVLTRGALLDRVWGYDYLGDSRLVDMAVKRLRGKLDDDAQAPRYITTVRGVGYRFERDR
jgi:two-component system response regulator MtrA